MCVCVGGGGACVRVDPLKDTWREMRAIWILLMEFDRSIQGCAGSFVVFVVFLCTGGYLERVSIICKDALQMHISFSV